MDTGPNPPDPLPGVGRGSSQSTHDQFPLPRGEGG